jgi:hypothetical protein
MSFATKWECCTSDAIALPFHENTRPQAERNTETDCNTSQCLRSPQYFQCVGEQKPVSNKRSLALSV